MTVGKERSQTGAEVYTDTLTYLPSQPPADAASSSHFSLSMKTRVVVIAIGGGTCSGKTTLAKQLSRVLPNCSLLNQDRYCIHEKNLPLHPIHNVPDPDEAETAIDWPGFRTGFEQLVKHGRAQEMTFNIVDVDSLSSFGYLPQPVLDRWRDRFLKIQDQWLSRGVRIEWRLVEGFIVFHDSNLMNSMDVKLFVRTAGRIMEARREFRVFDNG
ncbi:ribosylnicotinamide kinase, partial [Ceratobasidium sp. 428]